MQRLRQGSDADSRTLSRVDRGNGKGRKSRGQFVALKGADGVKESGLGQLSQAQKLSTKRGSQFPQTGATTNTSVSVWSTSVP
jgi:hypothetical protein